MPEKELIYYHTANNDSPFEVWLRRIKDKLTKARIVKRLERVSFGNYGDYKSVGQGVLELRLFFGPGYRIYFAEDGDTVVVLLTGGDKSSQADDVSKAQAYWRAYQSVKAGQEGKDWM